jgi:hypothetical protein
MTVGKSALDRAIRDAFRKMRHFLMTASAFQPLRYPAYRSRHSPSF